MELNVQPFTDRFITASKLSESLSQVTVMELQKPFIAKKLLLQIVLVGTNDNLPEVLLYYDCTSNKFPHVLTM